MSPGLARAYFLAQGVAVAAWWLVLALRPASRAAFNIRGAPDIALLAFAPGDLVVLASGSVVVAAAAGRAWTGALAWAVVGATLYGTLYTLAAALAGAASWLGVLLMAPAAVLSLLAARTLSRERRRDLPPGRSGEPGA